MYLFGGFFFLLFNLSFVLSRRNPLNGPYKKLNPDPNLRYNQDPFNLSSEDTAAYTAHEAPSSILSPAGTHDTIRADNLFAPNITGLKGVHPHGDRIRRTLCYCSDHSPGHKHGGGSYYHIEYYNAQLDYTYVVDWTCMHRGPYNKCQDRPKQKDKQCRKIVDGSQQEREFCVRLKPPVIKGWEYRLDGVRRKIGFEDRGLKTSMPKDVVMPVCRTLCDKIVGPAADRDDAFFNGIAYHENSIEDFGVLSDICFDGGPGSTKHGICRNGTFPANTTYGRGGLNEH